MKSRDQWWREGYRAKPYLSGKSNEHVVARLRYLIGTMLTLSPNGKIGMEGTDELGYWLLGRFTHTQEEMARRNLRPPDGFLTGLQVPQVSPTGKPPELICYERRRRTAPGEVFKFGKKKYLLAALTDGELRFAGARTYQDPSLNAAIQDDELAFTVYPYGMGTTSILGASSLGDDGGLTVTHPTDYYVQCLASAHTLRMYNDFSADSCLIIYDAKAFGTRIIEQLRLRLPDWIVGAIPVSYVDPDDPGESPLPIPAAKHMKYAYQREQRIIAHPRSECFEHLPPITITAGSLEDIAELVEL